MHHRTFCNEHGMRKAKKAAQRPNRAQVPNTWTHVSQPYLEQLSEVTPTETSEAAAYIIGKKHQATLLSP
jgi:hypothetical protein